MVSTYILKLWSWDDYKIIFQYYDKNKQNELNVNKLFTYFNFS